MAEPQRPLGLRDHGSGRAPTRGMGRADPGAVPGRVRALRRDEAGQRGGTPLVSPHVQVPSKWKGQRVLLHFGAVDWEATVWVNGVEVGSHRGGYDAFSFDVTDALRPSGDQELVVAVWDPTDAGINRAASRSAIPSGIWYTPTTGIWQTAWLEAVPETTSVRCGSRRTWMPRRSPFKPAPSPPPGPTTLEVEVLDGRKVVQRGEVTTEVMTRSIPPQIAPRITLEIPNAKALVAGFALPLRPADRPGEGRRKSTRSRAISGCARSRWARTRTAFSACS
jgi:hypothetical protein